MEQSVWRYEVVARSDGHGVSRATCKEAEPIPFDTSAGPTEAWFGPAELLATSLAACLLKNLARLAPKMRISYSGAEVRVTAIRVEDPPRISRLEYVLQVRTEEPDERIARLADRMVRSSTVHNTLSKACSVSGAVVREPPQAGAEPVGGGGGGVP